ncbi:MAG: hypothetical protein VYE62_12290, partial [Pseudomonadota bacterium]|nr:hypothetical protein [Pseudomonadota bacterium]
ATLGYRFFDLEKDQAAPRSRVEVEISNIMKIMVWGPFMASVGRKIDVGVVLRTMFLRDMACRDGLVLEKAV